MWRKFFFSFVIAFVWVAAWGASISGYLTDAQSGEPLPYANVYLEGEPLGSSTNDRGYYIIEGVEPGRHKLVATYLGYETFEATVEVEEGQRLRYDIALTPSAEVGAEVVVEARREGGERDLSVGHIIVSPQQARQASKFVEADLFRAIHLLPGVAAKSDFSSALYIWGGLPTQNLVTIDGIEVYNATHFGGLFSAFIVDALKEVNLIKGGFPAKYGGRIGSVLEIINREGNRRRIHGSGEVSLLSSHFVLHGPLPGFAGPGAWMLAARRTYVDLIFDALRAWGATDFDFPVHFTDIHTKLTRDFEKGDKLTLTYYHSKDVFDFEGESDTFYVGWGNNTFAANLIHLFTPKHFGHFLVAYSEFSDRFDAPEGDLMKDFVRDFTVRGVLSTAFPKHTVDLGFETKLLWVLNHVEFFDYPEPLWDWHNFGAIISLYGQDEFAPSPVWRFNFGLRNELCTSGLYFRLSPRVSAMRVIDEKTRLKLSVGQYYQFFQAVPKDEELGLSVFDTWVLAQDGLEPLWATHVVLRAETERLLGLPLTVDIYYKRMGNLWRHKQFYSPNERFADIFEEGFGWSSGADVMLRFNTMRWQGWLGYSFGYVVYSFPGISDGEPFYPKHDRRHSLSFCAARDIGRNWTLSLVWKYNSGSPYTKPLAVYQAPDDGGWETRFYYGGYHNARVPYYSRVDISISKRWVGRWLDVEAYFQILNLLNRKNIYSRYYDYDYFTGEVYENDIRLLPLTPTFGVRAWF